MKRYILALLLILAILLSGCGDAVVDTTSPTDTDYTESTNEGGSADTESDTLPSDKETEVPDDSTAADKEEDPVQEGCKQHTADADNDGYCDDCGIYVVFVVDFYAVNDLHGKFSDTDSQPGVDELTTYLKNARLTDDHVVLLSSGDMWQGSSESNLTKGLLITDWMNELDFDSMTLGNHEYDWGEEFVEANAKAAEFPILAINVYERATNQRVSYCQPSTMVKVGGVTVGIIGAIGDCYSSIASDKVENIYFKTGAELTALVKAESERLRAAGADLIVYSLHDGNSYGGGSSDSQIRSFYDVVLSAGYVDLVFEGHSHQSYTFVDSKGVYHLQGGGDNKGISHVEITINVANDKMKVNAAEFVSTSKYTSLAGDPIVQTLLDKYKNEIAIGSRVLGINDSVRSGDFLRQLVAQLYYEKGVELWGDRYNIVLGGGYLSVRSPGRLDMGEIKYADLQMIFPFDNNLVLCSISGANLKSRFINSTNSNYFMAYGEYGNSVKNSIDPNATYYIIVDSYSSTYAPNRLTVVDTYEADVFARDLLAAYVEAGGLGKGLDGNYTLTSIPDALAVGNALADNAETAGLYYVRGEIVSIENTKYGNMTIRDEKGNSLYVYGLYDAFGSVRFDAMEKQPAVGDVVTLAAPIKKYVSSSGVKVELMNARLIGIE